VSLNFHSVLRNFIQKVYTELSIGASYQIVAHVATRFQRRFFLEITRNKNCLCRPCLSMDQEEMSNLNRGPSIDPANQASVHLAKWFQRRRFFRNRPIRNNNCLWRPCLLTDQDKIRNLYKGSSIDALC
jgi:hypothetical protein